MDVKSAMVRMAATADGVEIDLASRLRGRGGYLHPQQECLQLFANGKKVEIRSLRRKLDREERVALVRMLEQRLATHSKLA